MVNNGVFKGLNCFYSLAIYYSADTTWYIMPKLNTQICCFGYNQLKEEAQFYHHFRNSYTTGPWDTSSLFSRYIVSSANFKMMILKLYGVKC